jgi:hypothetical protein
MRTYTILVQLGEGNRAGNRVTSSELQHSRLSRGGSGSLGLYGHDEDQRIET